MEGQIGWVIVRKMVAGQIVFEPCRETEKTVETLGLFKTEAEADAAIAAFQQKEFQ